MNLAFANPEKNRPSARLTDVALIRLVPDAVSVWVWCGSLVGAVPGASLHLFNLDPPEGDLSVDLGQLNWDWVCGGLALLAMPAHTFERNFGNVVPPSRSTPIPSGVTLRAALETLSTSPLNLDLLVSITDWASRDAAALLAVTHLCTYLEGIVSLDPALDQRQDAPGARHAEDRLRNLKRISLWTPGAKEPEFVGFYSPLIGEAEAKQLWTFNRAAVGAVAGGEFQKQVDIGDDLSRLVPEQSVLAGEAAYFKAEGLRLLGDLEPAGPQKTELRTQAFEAYERANQLLPDDPRPLRGLGRITEQQQDFDGALKYFKLAWGLCLTDGPRNSNIPELDLAHEILRTTRHFIHCLLDIRSTNPNSVWHRDHKERELEGYLQVCESFHIESMPKFEDEPEWYYIEWFMGFVFLAKAWGAVGNYERMQQDLIFALDARRRIMKPQPSLSKVERANLEWWLAVSRGPGNVLAPDFIKKLDRLNSALNGGDSAAVHGALADVVGRYVAPWSGPAGGPVSDLLKYKGGQ
jgi:tetratricopeptide (TPR) repeat protein